MAIRRICGVFTRFRLQAIILEALLFIIIAVEGCEICKYKEISKARARAL